jgi:hypothetical protein
MAKKIKVQLTSKKSTYVIGKHIYRPGDVFEVTEAQFDIACMVKVEEPKKPVKPPEEEATEAPTEDASVYTTSLPGMGEEPSAEPIDATPEEQVTKTRRRRKKSTS